MTGALESLARSHVLKNFNMIKKKIRPTMRATASKTSSTGNLKEAAKVGVNMMDIII